MVALTTGYAICHLREQPADDLLSAPQHPHHPSEPRANRVVAIEDGHRWWSLLRDWSA